MSAPKDYEVGFGRPPVHSRYPAGRSGNPTGRPKGSKNISAVISAALNERVTITANGKRRRVTKFEAAAMQLANKAAAGDPKCRRAE